MHEFYGKAVRVIWLGFCATTVARAVTGLENHHGADLLAMVDFAIFAAYWLRFLFGNVNYLDVTYTASFMRTMAGRTRARYDAVLMAVQGFSFLLLAGRSRRLFPIYRSVNPAEPFRFALACI